MNAQIIKIYIRWRKVLKKKKNEAWERGKPYQGEMLPF